MFMTGCVVLVMSSCHDNHWQVMMYCLCQGVISNNVITERMTLNDSCHKHAYNFLHIHVMISDVSLMHTPSSKVSPGKGNNNVGFSLFRPWHCICESFTIIRNVVI